MSEKITVEYQNVREKAREMSDNAKELWDKWEKHKRGYFLVLYFEISFQSYRGWCWWQIADVGDILNLSSTHFATNICHQYGYGLNILIGYKSLKELTESKKTNCFDFAIMYALCAQNYYKRYRKLVWLAILFIIFITFRRKIIGMISKTDKLANN